MSQEDVSAAYYQVVDDVAVDVVIREQDGVYIGFDHRDIGGTVDVWGADVLRIDGRSSTVDGGIVLWQDTAEKLDLGGSRSDHVILRDSRLDACWGAQLETGYLNVKDSWVGELALSGAVLDRLVLDDAAVGTVDLSGAAVGQVEMDDSYEFVVDEDTYVHCVPDELVAALGYRQVTEQEQQVLYAVDRLGYRSRDPVDRETVSWYVRDVLNAVDSEQQVYGIVSSLSRKQMLETGKDQYSLTRRGVHAHTALHG